MAIKIFHQKNSIYRNDKGTVRAFASDDNSIIVEYDRPLIVLFMVSLTCALLIFVILTLIAFRFGSSTASWIISEIQFPYEVLNMNLMGIIDLILALVTPIFMFPILLNRLRRIRGLDIPSFDLSIIFPPIVMAKGKVKRGRWRTFERNEVLGIELRRRKVAVRVSGGRRFVFRTNSIEAAADVRKFLMYWWTFPEDYRADSFIDDIAGKPRARSVIRNLGFDVRPFSSGTY